MNFVQNRNWKIALNCLDYGLKSFFENSNFLQCFQSMLSLSRPKFFAEILGKYCCWKITETAKFQHLKITGNHLRALNFQKSENSEMNRF